MNQREQESFKVIIAGGRYFNNYGLLKTSLDNLLRNKSSVEIVSGKAKGADTLGEKYAREVGHSLVEFPALWGDMSEPCRVKTRKNGTQYNALAGHKRNLQMAQHADALVAFWDGKSTGTKNMIDTAKKLGLLVRIIRY